MDLSSILGSVVSGGVTGVIGSAITGVMSYKDKQLQYKHELDMELAARETMRLEYEQKAKVAVIEGDAAVEKAEVEAFAESIRADKATYSAGIAFDKVRGGWIYAMLMVIVDFLRGIIRPATTILFIVMTFVMYFSLNRRVSIAGSDPKAVMELFGQVVTVVLYLATTTVCWWFGARGISKSVK